MKNGPSKVQQTVTTPRTPMYFIFHRKNLAWKKMGTSEKYRYYSNGWKEVAPLRGVHSGAAPYALLEYIDLFSWGRALDHQQTLSKVKGIYRFRKRGKRLTNSDAKQHFTFRMFE